MWQCTAFNQHIGGFEVTVHDARIAGVQVPQSSTDTDQTLAPCSVGLAECQGMHKLLQRHAAAVFQHERHVTRHIVLACPVEQHCVRVSQPLVDAHFLPDIREALFLVHL